MAKTVEITDQNFAELVEQSDKPVMVDFWAAWCGPCLMVAPILDQIADEYGEKAVIGKLDVDNNPETAAKFGIRSIPTLLYFKDGKVVDKVVGAGPKPLYTEKLDTQIA